LSYLGPIPDPSSVSPGVRGMADDAATEADRPEQEREYEQLQAEQARGRGEQERSSFRARWCTRMHRWADGNGDGRWGT
jgi:hypothetical protein